MTDRIPHAAFKHQHLATGGIAAQAPAGVIRPAGADQIDITGSRCCRRWIRRGDRALVTQTTGDRHPQGAISGDRHASAGLDPAQHGGGGHWRIEGGGLVADEVLAGRVGLRPVRVRADAANGAHHRPLGAIKSHQLVLRHLQAAGAAPAGMQHASAAHHPDITRRRSRWCHHPRLT